jgi:cytochrome c oxidase subunit 2
MHLVSGRNLLDRPIATQRFQRNLGLEICRKSTSCTHLRIPPQRDGIHLNSLSDFLGPPQYEPENTKLEWWLTILTALGVVAMLTPGLFVWNQFVTVPEEAAEFEVLGQQWQWSFRYPRKNGVLGTSDTGNISDENPFGLNTDDPNGRDDILVAGDDLHLPIGRPVKVLLRSIDVLHDFYVPEFRAKMDMVPGAVTYFWLTPTRTGTFDILCFKLCGIGHHAMRGNVVVEEESAY